MANPLDVLPAGVVDALKRGNKIEAIKRFREATGVGLAEAKAAVEAAEGHSAFGSSMTPAHHAPTARNTGLAPGEVPKSSGNALAYIAIAVAAAVAGWLFAKFG